MYKGESGETEVYYCKVSVLYLKWYNIARKQTINPKATTKIKLTLNIKIDMVKNKRVDKI